MGSADGQVIGSARIVDHGPAEERFNLVLVSEGYRQDELGQFSADALRFTERLFSTPPFDETRCAINVYRVDVASTESGADDPLACGGTDAAPATYFDASFCHYGAQRVLMVNGSRVRGVVDACVPQWHQILVIVNSPVYGGSGGTVCVSSTAAGWMDVAIHEIGHASFDLADEYESYFGCGLDADRDHYAGGEPAECNVSRDIAGASLKWGDLIQAATPMPTTTNADCTLCDPQPSPVPPGTVGAFEGARYYHCGIYRPEYDCMMRNLKGFCAVCRRRIRQTLEPFMAACYAPVFPASSGLACLITIIGCAIVLVFLLPFQGRPGVSCMVKRLRFRIARCCKGNADGCIPL